MVLAHDVHKGYRTQDIKISVDITFDSMLLTGNTLKGLKNSGFNKPSPVQLHGIPLGKCGFDLFLEAKSGTGKTAVFTVIALEKLDLDKGLQSIILAPTREIAAQISDVIKQIGSNYEDLNVEVVMGGLPIEQDIEKFRKKVHILVGSPGRMRHLIQSKHIDVSAVRLFVLDEADKLMDKSFQADINYIFSVLPKQKQVIMSSATYPNELKSIMQNYVQKAQHICPDSTNILLGIKQLVTTVKSNINIVRQTQNKFEELLKILSSREFKQCLIFCNYQVRVGELCKMLMREKWPAEQLHGQLDQTDRLDALKTLQQYKCRILVSTDLAARGIDASNVDLVVNFEPPFEWQTYLHRIGRTGRFGSYGIAITILSEGKEETQFKEMIKTINYLPNLNYLWGDHKFELNDPNSNCCPEQKPVQQILETVEVEDTCKASELVKMNKIQEIRKKYNTLEIKQMDNTHKLEEVNKTIKCEEEEMCKLLVIDDVVEEETKNCKMKLRPQYVNVENNNEDDIFAKIFKSFEKSEELKIECFDNLIASFKNHEPNKDESNEMQDAPFHTYFDFMLNIETVPNIILESISDMDLEENKYIKESKNTADSCNFKENMSTNSLNMLNKRLDKEEYLTNSDRTYHKALKNAGLPISFSSKKYCNTNQVHETKLLKKSEYVPNKQKLNNTANDKSCDKNNSLSTRNKVLIEKHVKNSSEASPISFYDDDGYNTHSCRNSRSTKYLHANNKKGQTSYSRNDILSDSSEMYDNSIEMSFDSHKKYSIWYKQMKTHIKQVEMSVYIEELSKM